MAEERRRANAATSSQISAVLTEREHKAEVREKEERRRAESQRKPGARFRDRGGRPEMVVVPTGEFVMGSSASKEGRYDDEDPVHRVRIAHPFAVGVYEVTHGEFARFVGATGHLMGDTFWTFEHYAGRERSGRYWRHPGYVQTDGHPVVCELE